MKMSRRQTRLMTIAREVAKGSSYSNFRHGAVLTKGGSILNVAPNVDDWTAFGRRFREEPGKATRHAEVNCILGLDKSLTKGADVYVCRIGRKGDLRYSKPCPMCQSVLSFVGVKRCYYSINERELGVIKL